MKQNRSNGQCLWVRGTALMYRLYYLPIAKARFRRHSNIPTALQVLERTSPVFKSLGTAITALVAHSLPNVCSRRLPSNRGHWHCRHKDGFSLALRPRSRYIFGGKPKICKIWQEASLVSLSVPKTLLFHQENASINAALNSHWCPKEDFEKTFNLKTSLLMCHLQHASLTPRKCAWKQGVIALTFLCS